MRENLEEMNRRGVDTPVILGGAALTRAYVEDDCRRDLRRARCSTRRTRSRASRSWSASSAGEPSGPRRASTRSARSRPREAVDRGRAGRRAAPLAAARPRPRPACARLPSVAAPRRKRARSCRATSTYPEPPFLGPRVIEAINLQSVIPYVNETTLFQFQWGYRRKGQAAQGVQGASSRSTCARSLRAREAVREGEDPQPQGGLRLLACVPEGDTLVLLASRGRRPRGGALHLPAPARQEGPVHHRLLPRATARPTWSRCRS